MTTCIVIPWWILMIWPTQLNPHGICIDDSYEGNGIDIWKLFHCRFWSFNCHLGEDFECFGSFGWLVSLTFICLWDLAWGFSRTCISFWCLLWPLAWTFFETPISSFFGFNILVLDLFSDLMSRPILDYLELELDALVSKTSCSDSDRFELNRS